MPELMPASDIIGMKNWDDEKQCWIGVICQVMVVDGKESVHVYDVERAETQVEIDDWIKEAIATKPWLNAKPLDR